MEIADMFMTVCVNICCIVIKYMLVIFGYYEEKFFPCSMRNSHVWLSIVLQWSMNFGLKFFFCMNLLNLAVFLHKLLYTYETVRLHWKLL